MQQGRRSYSFEVNVRRLLDFAFKAGLHRMKKRDDTMTPCLIAAVAALALMCQLRASERAAGCHSRYRWNIGAISIY
jgi:hypothetical protein